MNCAGESEFNFRAKQLLIGQYLSHDQTSDYQSPFHENQRVNTKELYENMSKQNVQCISDGNFKFLSVMQICLNIIEGLLRQ